MGDGRISKQIEWFLDYMYERLGLDRKDDKEIFSAVMLPYLKPIMPIYGEGILLRKHDGNGLFIYCSFKEVRAGAGYYITTRLRRLEKEDLDEMRHYCRLIERTFGCRKDLDLIEPINTVVAFHLLLNEFLHLLPVEEGRISAPTPSRKAKKK